MKLFLCDVHTGVIAVYDGGLIIALSAVSSAIERATFSSRKTSNVG